MGTLRYFFLYTHYVNRITSTLNINITIFVEAILLRLLLKKPHLLNLAELVCCVRPDECGLIYQITFKQAQEKVMIGIICSSLIASNTISFNESRKVIKYPDNLIRLQMTYL
jgi:hypothetical protein